MQDGDVVEFRFNVERVTEHHIADLANAQVKWGLTLRGQTP